MFRHPSGGLLSPLEPTWVPAQFLSQNKPTQMLNSFTTACKDLATLEVVSVAEYRLNGLQQATPAPPTCRVPHCPFDAFHPVCDIEMPGVGYEGDGELFCAPGGLSFLTISHTGGLHSWKHFALVPIFMWCFFSCLRQLLVLVSRKSCPCCCPCILFPLCNCSAAVRPTCGLN